MYVNDLRGGADRAAMPRDRDRAGRQKACEGCHLLHVRACTPPPPSGTMVWCENCSADVLVDVNTSDGFSCVWPALSPPPPLRSGDGRLRPRGVAGVVCWRALAHALRHTSFGGGLRLAGMRCDPATRTCGSFRSGLRVAGVNERAALAMGSASLARAGGAVFRGGCRLHVR